LGLKDLAPQTEELEIANLIDEDITNQIFIWIQDNTGYLTLFIGLFMTFGIKLFFRKAGYTFFEIFTLMCFVFGLTSLSDSVVTVFQSVTKLKIIQALIFVETFYITYAVGQFFDRKRAVSFIKAFLSYVFGYLMIILLIAVISGFFVVLNLI
jgi:hypothetical protein